MSFEDKVRNAIISQNVGKVALERECPKCNTNRKFKFQRTGKVKCECCDFEFEVDFSESVKSLKNIGVK